jgi:endonuclease/exonuclease/phosphatase family metal-dependent hydrolase
MPTIKIVTFNMRCAWGTDGINSFMHRVGLIYDKLNAEKPDVVAFQECTPKIMDLMEKMFPEYSFHGMYRSENYWGEGLFIAVRKELFRAVSCENFWLSPTPYVPGSRFPVQSDCPRICNVVEIRRRESGEMLRIFNLHLDHISDEARIEGMKCVLEKMEEYNARLPMPSVLLGDYNAGPECSTIKYCNSYGKTPIFDVTGDIPLTYHGFGGVLIPEWEKIDYIYVTEELAGAHVKTETWEEEHHGIYLSDHYPVCAEFEY